MEYRKGMLPQTDSLLNRTINISIGGADPGIGASFGVTMNDELDVVEQCAEEFHRIAKKHLYWFNSPPPYLGVSLKGY